MNLKIFLTTFLSCIIVVCIQAQESFTFDHEGVERSFLLYLPENLVEDAPLVFVLHGLGSSNEEIMMFSEMNMVADENGFAVCYPQGARTDLGFSHWNANLNISEVDDVGFLAALANYLQATYNLSVENTFSCGMSNGGFMSYTLACERTDLFKAIASVTGTMSGYDWENCDPSRALPVLQMSGTADRVVPIDGSLTELGGWGGAPGMEAVVNYWTTLNECGITDSMEVAADFATVIKKYTNCTENNQVWEYLIEDWGHEWPMSTSGTGFGAGAEIWDFFSTFIEVTTNTEDFSNHALSIYPNPAQTTIYVNTTGLGNSTYIFHDLTGRLVKSGQLMNQQQQIYIQELPNGIYILKMDGRMSKVVKAD